MKQLDTSPDAPWKQRFRIQTTAGYVAPGNQSRGLATSNRSGVTQLYAWDVKDGTLRQITHVPEGKSSGTLSSDGRFVYYLDDKQGNELGHYVRVPFEGGELQDITPDMPPYASFGLNSSRDGSTIGFTHADQNGFHVYVANSSGETISDLRKLHHFAALSFGPKLSHGGEYAVIMTTEGMSGLNSRLVAFDVSTGEQTATLQDAEESGIEPNMFSPLPGDSRLIATTNRSGVNRPLIWDVRSGERIDLEFGELAGDVSAQSWSPDGQELLLLQISEARHQLYRYNLDSGALTRLEHPSGTFFGAYFFGDDRIFANWQSSTSPGQLIILDRATGKQTGVALAPSEAPPSRAWRSVSFPSTNGQTIQAWLVTPEGEGPFPTVLETHGGPTWAMTDLYHSGSQAWVDHGFAFLSVNYRGSTTFGREFERAIWGDLGHWEVDDMAAARSWLIENGIAEPDGIILTGWSYGGYLTLQALGKEPKLWAGGMAGIAIADWAVQYEDTADTLKGYQVALLGGTPQEKPEVYAAASPITYAKQVAAPVLVIQGSNDTRCPARPMRNYEAKLRELGKDIEVVWFEAGHGSNDVEQSVEHQELMLRFAYRVLG